MNRVYDASTVPCEVTHTNHTGNTVAMEFIPFGTQEIQPEGVVKFTIKDSETLLLTMLRAENCGLVVEVAPTGEQPDEEPVEHTEPEVEEPVVEPVEEEQTEEPTEDPEVEE